MIGKDVCPRCVVMYLNIKDSDLLKKSDAIIINHLEKRWPSLAKDERETRKNTCKNKYFCHSCLGMLQDQFIEYCAKNIAEKICAEKYLFQDFKLMISQPVQFLFFQPLIRHQYENDIMEHRDNGNGLEIKDIFKIVLEPKLEKLLNSKAVTNENAELDITVFMKHVSTELDLLPKIEERFPECFEKSKKVLEVLTKKRPRNDLTHFTLSAVSKALSRLDMTALNKLNEKSYFKSSVVVDKIHITRAQIYIAGRYCKYSRDLSQTPWILAGERKSEMSVQEYIADPIQQAIKADSYNFSSSGREDIDVRTLGNGRPFLIELINPRQCMLQQNSVLKNLQAEINESTNLISVRDLQVVSKNETKHLKDGEEGKTKSYTAVCYTKTSHSYPKIKRPKLEKNILELSNMKNVKIDQKTPLRVLHRRNLAARQRCIYELDVSLMDVTDAAKVVKIPGCVPKDYIFFKVDMTTQAGTYVKEFVHGDFGRTVPCLGVLIGADTDILSLDVVSVNLDWPPQVLD